MKPQKQINLHKPDEKIYGDCHRTVYAAMLDMNVEDIPHFVHDWPGAIEGNRRAKEWLNAQGYTEFNIVFGTATLDDVFTTMKAMNRDIYYLLAGTSKTNVDHFVICCNDEIVCDPSQNDSGIVGPCEDGYFWVTIFIPLRFTTVSARVAA